MTQLFLRLFNISVTAGWIVVAVMAVRLLFRRMPRWGYCLLWGIAGVRLLLPITLESPLSLLPSPELIPQNITALDAPAINSGIPAINRVINPIFVTEPVWQNLSLELLFQVAAWVWVAGMVLILAYGLISYGKLCRQVRASVPGEEGIYLCDDIQSPFLLGIFKPRIYVPSGLDDGLLHNILAHERAHIRRKDHLWKPLGFLLLSVYWFQPLLWAGYILLCRDIERACDEKVIKNKDNLFRVQYMESLVSCSLHRRMILACPVAFGEVSVKSRVKGIARYKKPTMLVILASVLTCAVVCICFLTTPKACAHDYTSETTLQATCTDHGVQTNTCRLCDHTYLQTTDCLAHAYDEGVVNIEATCTATGNRTRRCTDCGAVRKEIIPMAAHTPGELTVTQEPNCVESGAIRSECTHCRVRFIVERPAPNGQHEIKRHVIKAPTCTETGLAEDRCIHCGMGEEVVLEPVAHEFETTASEKPNCAFEGYETHTCIRCDYEYVKTLPREIGAHSWNSSSGCCGVCGLRSGSSGGQYDYIIQPTTGGSTSTVPQTPKIDPITPPSPKPKLPELPRVPHPLYG